MGESKLQKKCCDYARNWGVLARKVHVERRKGWPDLLLIFPYTGETVYVEMKNPNGKGKIAELQRTEHQKIVNQGASAYFCENFNIFRALVQTHLHIPLPGEPIEC